MASQLVLPFVGLIVKFNRYTEYGKSVITGHNFAFYAAFKQSLIFSMANLSLG